MCFSDLILEQINLPIMKVGHLVTWSNVIKSLVVRDDNN